MPVQRLNHAVLYVRDVERSPPSTATSSASARRWRSPAAAVFLQAEGSTNDHDLGPVPDRRRRRARPRPAAAPSGSTTWPGRSTRSPSWPASGTRCSQAGALVGASDHATTKALYAQDPDGIEFEVSWLLPADLITPEVTRGRGHDRAAGPRRARSPATARRPAAASGSPIPA